LDYCGSRTEPCPKCGAFIMLKEQDQHEQLNCRKPAPVVNNNVPVTNGFGIARGLVGASNGESRSRYDVDEMSRMLGAQLRVQDTSVPSVPAAAVRKTPAPRKPLQDKRTPKVSNVKSNVNRRQGKNEFEL